MGEVKGRTSGRKKLHRTGVLFKVASLIVIVIASREIPARLNRKSECD